MNNDFTPCEKKNEFVYTIGAPGCGGTGGMGICESTVQTEMKQQKCMDLIAEFWNHYQAAMPAQKVDITANDVKQMLILVDIAKIATEYEDGQP